MDITVGLEEQAIQFGLDLVLLVWARKGVATTNDPNARGAKSRPSTANIQRARVNRQDH